MRVLFKQAITCVIMPIFKHSFFAQCTEINKEWEKAENKESQFV